MSMISRRFGVIRKSFHNVVPHPRNVSLLVLCLPNDFANLAKMMSQLSQLQASYSPVLQFFPKKSCHLVFKHGNIHH